MKRFNDWWAVALDPSVDQKLLQPLHKVFFQFNIEDPKNIVPIVANDVLDRMQPP